MTLLGKRYLRDRLMAARVIRLLLSVGAAIALVIFAPVNSGSSIFASLGDWSLGRVAHAAPARVVKGALAPDIAFTTTEGDSFRLSQFRGRPLMLWFFASWCPSCVAGTTAVVERFDELKESGLRIVQLRLYNNLGYRGPSAEEFAKRYAADTYPSSDWLWGEASLETSVTFDPKGYPDIYFLIDANGVVRDFDGAPNVSIDKIVAFAAAGNQTIQKGQAE